MGSRYHSIDYNKSEAEFYQLAKLAGVESGFAWTYKFFDYTLPSGKTIEVYASQFCDCNADALVAEVRRLIEDKDYRTKMLDNYADIRNELGGSGASSAVAKAMIEELK